MNKFSRRPWSRPVQGNMDFWKRGNPCFWNRESGKFFSCGVRNRGLYWEPGIQLNESETPLTTGLEPGIQVPLTENPESTACNPESRTILDSLISYGMPRSEGNLYLKKDVIRGVILMTDFLKLRGISAWPAYRGSVTRLFLSSSSFTLWCFCVFILQPNTPDGTNKLGNVDGERQKEGFSCTVLW